MDVQKRTRIMNYEPTLNLLWKRRLAHKAKELRVLIIEYFLFPFLV